MGNSHAIWDHSVTRHLTEVRILHLQLNWVLDLATPEGCKAELTYVTWKQNGRELNPRPVSRKSNALPRRHLAARCVYVDLFVFSSDNDDVSDDDDDDNDQRLIAA